MTSNDVPDSGARAGRRRALGRGPGAPRVEPVAAPPQVEPEAEAHPEHAADAEPEAVAGEAEAAFVREPRPDDVAGREPERGPGSRTGPTAEPPHPDLASTPPAPEPVPASAVEPVPVHGRSGEIGAGGERGAVPASGV
ncbi:hypothetical protein ACWGJM_04855, partial [Streptomyces sp. NPDC054834]